MYTCARLRDACVRPRARALLCGRDHTGSLLPNRNPPPPPPSPSLSPSFSPSRPPPSLPPSLTPYLPASSLSAIAVRSGSGSVGGRCGCAVWRVAGGWVCARADVYLGACARTRYVRAHERTPSVHSRTESELFRARMRARDKHQICARARSHGRACAAAGSHTRGAGAAAPRGRGGRGPACAAVGGGGLALDGGACRKAVCPNC